MNTITTYYMYRERFIFFFCRSFYELIWFYIVSVQFHAGGALCVFYKYIDSAVEYHTYLHALRTNAVENIMILL